MVHVYMCVLVHMRVFLTRAHQKHPRNKEYKFKKNRNKIDDGAIQLRLPQTYINILCDSFLFFFALSSSFFFYFIFVSLSFRTWYQNAEITIIRLPVIPYGFIQCNNIFVSRWYECALFMRSQNHLKTLVQGNTIKVQPNNGKWTHQK